MNRVKLSQIRDSVLKQRKHLSFEEVRQRSEQMIQHFLEVAKTLPVRLPPQLHVACYDALADEVCLESLGPVVKSLQWKVYFPRVIKRGDQKGLEFVEMDSIDLKNAKIQVGSFGIREPHPYLQPVDPKQLNLIWVPGVAFGPQGERVGRGAGYYDRFLPLAPQALRVSLAFDFQLFSSLPQQPWDVPVHWVITEKREFKTEFVDHWSRQGGNPS